MKLYFIWHDTSYLNRTHWLLPTMVKITISNQCHIGYFTFQHSHEWCTKFRIFKRKPLFPLPLQQIRVVPSQKWKVLSTIVFVCIGWWMLYKFPRVISDKFFFFCSNCQLPMFCLMLKIPHVVSNSPPFVPYSLPKVILFQPMLVCQTEALSQKVWNSHFVMGQSTRLLSHI